MEAKMQIAICDDEKSIRELIGNKVHSIYPEADLCFFQSGEELLLSEEHLDILFLDIQMTGINGMETAGEFRKKRKKAILIFVTVIEDYVFQAFDVGAFHYLLKPIDDKKFEEVLCKAVEEYRMKKQEVPAAEEKYIIVNSKGVHTKVLLDDVIYAEVFNRKIVLHKKDSEIEYYGKMSDLETKAGKDFFRTHRAYLVNFKYVEKYDASTIYLEKGTALMAKQHYSKFVKEYLKYNQRKGKELWIS